MADIPQDERQNMMATRQEWINREGFMGNLSYESEQQDIANRQRAENQVRRICDKHGLRLTADEHSQAIRTLMAHNCDDRYGTELILTQLKRIDSR